MEVAVFLKKAYNNSIYPKETKAHKLKKQQRKNNEYMIYNDLTKQTKAHNKSYFKANLTKLFLIRDYSVSLSMIYIKVLYIISPLNVITLKVLRVFSNIQRLTHVLLPIRSYVAKLIYGKVVVSVQ